MPEMFSLSTHCMYVFGVVLALNYDMNDWV